METAVSKVELLTPGEKVEFDNTYNGENESGYSTQQSDVKSSAEWDFHSGEITDASSFDPPIRCSSNIKLEALDCDYSSIAGLFHVNDLRGNVVYHN